MSLFTGLEEIVTENEILSSYTWYRIGGPAKYFIRPRSQTELCDVIRRCTENNFPWRIMGHGANLLIDDKGLNCAVIKLDESSFKDIELGEDQVTLGASVSMSRAIQDTIKAGLSGMESLVGIPGSIGGAIKMNAGGRFGDIGTLARKVEVVDASGTTSWREKPELIFEYRHVNIVDQIITRVELDLIPDDAGRMLNRMRETWILKKNTQPLSLRSAGCVFKNIPGQPPTGLLIDKLGFKGKNVGGAVVSQQHANFIVNENNASFSDIMQLTNQIKTAVYDQQGVELEFELEVWQD